MAMSTSARPGPLNKDVRENAREKKAAVMVGGGWVDQSKRA